MFEILTNDEQTTDALLHRELEHILDDKQRRNKVSTSIDTDMLTFKALNHSEFTQLIT